MNQEIVQLGNTKYGFRESTREVFDRNHNQNWKTIGKLADGKDTTDFRQAMHEYRTRFGTILPETARPSKKEYLRDAGVIV